MIENRIAHAQGYLDGLKQGSMYVPPEGQQQYMNMLLHAHQNIDHLNRELASIRANEIFNTDLKDIIKK